MLARGGGVCVGAGAASLGAAIGSRGSGAGASEVRDLGSGVGVGVVAGSDLGLAARACGLPGWGSPGWEIWGSLGCRLLGW